MNTLVSKRQQKQGVYERNCF